MLLAACGIAGALELKCGADHNCDMLPDMADPANSKHLKVPSPFAYWSTGQPVCMYACVCATQRPMQHNSAGDVLTTYIIWRTVWGVPACGCTVGARCD